ncbi:MAG: lysoplasmalogenase [Persicimonas sp.]
MGDFVENHWRKHVPLAVAVGLVATALFIYGVVLDDYWLRVITKPFPVLAMMVAVAAHGRGRYARTILVGLGLCIFGDIFLEIGQSTFLIGMIAFLCGHIAYVVAFLRRSRSLRPLEALPFVCWIGWAATTLWPHLGEMRIPVVAYTSVILVMLWRSAALVAGQKRPGGWDWAALVGAVLFGFSDTLIALDRFQAPIDGVRVPIILTYWGGQLLIAASTLSDRTGKPDRRLHD